jgi:hypothetical protein
VAYNRDMLRGDEPAPDGSVIDTTAQPHWLRTGYRFFPYAAQQSGQWWVLRLNHGFPEHDMYTLFIDGRPTADITGNPNDRVPLVASIASLKPQDRAAEPTLDPGTAATVVSPISRYANYGSEWGDPCMFCSNDQDGMALTLTWSSP